MKRPASTPTSKFIKPPRETVYRAFTDPAAWPIPGQMIGKKMYDFDLCVGGGYRMSLLFYLSSDAAKRGRPRRGETDAASGVSTKHYS
jgi:hypothetical protein